MLEIFGRCFDPLGPITALERELRRQEQIIDPGSTPVGDIWSEADNFRGSLVRAGVGSGYLVGIGVSRGRQFSDQGYGRDMTL